ncbi:hypothetical protein [Caulobacter sp. BK020]|uniref:hypothetical protein n=1 Tax=Caulobacter sp. BK020 TaxID=2512117 RepID=UPI0010538438|nr:hypothetical protein [Caulobacter sp. BK020]TCS10436.1 hypothetical protein EV278_11717 [Caulobacter sp. BK020]
MDTIAKSAAERAPASRRKRASKVEAAADKLTGASLEAAYSEARDRAQRAEAELALVRLQLEAYQQELFESERQSAWLAAERQGLVGQIAYLEARPREGEPATGAQSRLAELENAALLNASYIRSLESWVSRVEERATRAEAELEAFRARP